MSQSFLKVRMLRHIDQFTQVWELEMDKSYLLTAESAQRLIDAGAAVLDPSPKRLDAAALEAPTRRG
jgi:hypothetical protein